MPGEIVVWVPTGRVANTIKTGSGVVSSQPPNRGRIVVDFEGNLHGSPALGVYADRVLHAWDRQHTGYPTVARLWAKEDGSSGMDVGPMGRTSVCRSTDRSGRTRAAIRPAAGAAGSFPL